jgi:CheY-like chemotaxis protein
LRDIETSIYHFRSLLPALYQYQEKRPDLLISSECVSLEKTNGDYLVKPVSWSSLLAVVAGQANAGSTILVVEDEQEMARLIRRQLNALEQGYRLLYAREGRSAVALMRQRRPDLVLLDLGLPEQNGYQVLEEKNSDAQLRQIPVVIISARDPYGEPVVTDRLRVELNGGLSLRDVVHCTLALSKTLSPLKPSDHPMRSETSLAPPVFG